MFKQLTKGLAVVLIASLLVAGCSDGRDQILFVGSRSLANNDTLPANSIADNNLAADGGGLSPNGTDLDTLWIAFNTDSCTSDGIDGSDCTAIVLFTVNDLSSGHRRLFGCYFNGSALSTPTELRAEDRDYMQGVSLTSYTLVFLATEGFTTTDPLAGFGAQQNRGKWLIVGDYTTFTDDPRNDTTQAVAGALGPHRAIAYWIFDPALAGSGIRSSDQIGGVARTFENGFLQSGIQLETARGGDAVDLTSSNGAGPGATAVTAPACDVTSYGLVSDGYAGQTRFGGTALPLSRGLPAGGSVTFANATAYTHAYPTTNDATLFRSLGLSGERVSYVGLFYTQVVSSIADPSANTISSYTNGVGAGTDDFRGGAQLQMKFQGFDLATLTFGAETLVNPASSREDLSAANTTTRSAVGWYPTFYGYNGFVFAKYADASLSKGTPGGINPDELDGLSIRVPVAGRRLNAGSSPVHEWSYTRNSPSGGDLGRPLERLAMYEDICAVLRIADGGAAEAVLATVGSTVAGAPFDLSQWTTGTAGRHDTTNPGMVANSGTDRGNGGDTVIDSAPNREMMNFNPTGAFVFGADEGLGDVTLFYLSSDNTRLDASGTQNSASGGPTNNMDRALMAAAFNLDGTLVNSGANANPRVVSTHDNDFERRSVSSDPFAFTNEINDGKSSVDSDQTTDPLVPHPGGWFDARINRTGEYVAIGYLQNEGTSIDFYQALKCVAYQTFRRSYTVTLATQISQTGFDARFAGPVDLSARAAGTAVVPGNSASDMGTMSSNVAFFQFDAGDASRPTVMGHATGRVSDWVNWSHQPVNSWRWQDGLGYRCGFQSDVNVMNVLYEQSDATEDAVYVRAVDIVPDFLSSGGLQSGTPTIEAGTQAEAALLVSSPAVPGHANYARRSFATGYGTSSTPPSTLAPPTSSFRFIQGDVVLGTTVQACDLGANDAGVGGGLLIVWHQTIDNTDSDNDRGDRGLFAARFGDVADQVTDVVEIGLGTNEDAQVFGVQGGHQESGFAVATVDDGADSDYAGTGGVGPFQSSNRADSASAGGYDLGNLLLVCLPNNANVESTRNYSASSRYLYFRGPAAGNVSGSKALFTRRFDATIRGSAVLASQTPEFGNRFTPPVGAGPGTTAFLPPTRLDHEKGGDVSGLVGCSQRTGVLVLFQQDGHVWAQLTPDGVSYRTTNGAGNPALVDNDSTANVAAWVIGCCFDGQGDFVSGVFAMGKDDINGSGLRARLRLFHGVN